MILIDYSQVAISNIMSFKQDLIQAQMTGDTKGSEDIIRHCILSSLKMYKKRFGKDYGDVVVCCDSYNYWRKDYRIGQSATIGLLEKSSWIIMMNDDDAD